MLNVGTLNYVTGRLLDIFDIDSLVAPKQAY